MSMSANLDDVVDDLYTLESNDILSDTMNNEDDNGYTILNRMLWELEYRLNEGVDFSSTANKIAKCKLLVQCGADVNAGWTPPHGSEVKPLQLVNDMLTVGVFEEDFLDLFQCMVDNGADVNIGGSGGGYLIEGCDVGVTRILASSGRLDASRGRPFADTEYVAGEENRLQRAIYLAEAGFNVNKGMVDSLNDEFVYVADFLIKNHGARLDDDIELSSLSPSAQKVLAAYTLTGSMFNRFKAFKAKRDVELRRLDPANLFEKEFRDIRMRKCGISIDSFY